MCENEPDSEDDFEGYFLKPVNAYNIVDRIKDANKELFATPQPSSPAVINRKVTFRDILEDYEPTSEDGPTENALMESIPQESDENNLKLLTGETVTKKFSEDDTRDTMSDSSDHNIEEICEEVDSLEVQDPDGECKKIILAEMEKRIQKESESSEAASSSVQQSRSTESLSTSVSQSSEDSPSIIQVCGFQDDRNNMKPNENPTFHSNDTLHTVESTENGSVHRIKPQYTSNILKLRLNYRTCCEYKNSFENLPRYSGYFSQYGLSKEQWERRDKRYEKNHKRKSEKSTKTTEVQHKKMEDNERAFTNWLRNKMRFPINKTKNMFDFKPSRLRRKRKQGEIKE